VPQNETEFLFVYMTYCCRRMKVISDVTWLECDCVCVCVCVWWRLVLLRVAERDTERERESLEYIWAIQSV